jgi:hypothetical protein
VSPIDDSKHPTWPPGLVNIGFSGLKQKLLGSIVAIAAVNVLEWFTDIDRNSDSVKLAWVVGILLAFAVAMLVLAIADRVSGATVRRRIDDPFGAEVTAGPRSILDHEGLSQPIGKPLADQPRRDIDAAPGRKRRNDAHRPRGIALRAGQPR